MIDQLLSVCDREPIHIPGAIQPHGGFLAALADGQTITHASANIEAFMGRTAGAMLGRTLAEVIGKAARRALWEGEPGGAPNGRRLHTRRRPDGTLQHLRTHRSGRYICLDITPAVSRPGQAVPLTMLQSLLDRFKGAGDIAGLCDLAVGGVKAITGYDRVMVYRFAADGHGEVIAEARVPGSQSYLGLHYPAGDVPPQARLLTLRQRVGAIADTGYTPVPLLADPALGDDATIDLTCSALRSVSPLHREYLQNMGVAACLTVGLVAPSAAHPDGQLWGMMVCHHATPRVAGPEVRAVVDMIGQVMSLLLRSAGEAELATRRVGRDAALRAVVAQLAGPCPLPAAIEAAESDLLRLVDAAGALVRIADSVFTLGRTPPADAARRALSLLRRQEGNDPLAVDDLGLRFPELAACCAKDGSGALLVPLAPGDFVLLFRPELAQTIDWAGDPDRHCVVHADSGRLSPRASFAAFRATVSGRSAPWAAVDLAMARELQRAVAAEMAQRAKADLTWRRYHDPLTGLPNQSLLEFRRVRAGLESGGTIKLLFVYVEGTKAINYERGYAATDRLLVEVARRLVQAAGPEHFAARLGGVQFAVMCRGLDSGRSSALAERVRAAIAAPFEIDGEACGVSAIVTIVEPDPAARLDLMQVANASMQEGMLQKAQRQKMETLGRIMGGVAHEINNMLQPIALLAQDVIDNDLAVEAGRPHLDIILDCTLKARQIIGDLLAFSRPTASASETLDPAVLLEDTMRLVRQAIPSSVSIDVAIAGPPCVVTLNRTNFVQVLLNLATNAAAAMNDDGHLTITLDAADLAEGDARPGPGRFVRLRVADTGSGMDKATLDRVFEPFFTTKPIGKGTGLGLPMVYGLVQGMGGTITLTSEPGRGTIVTVTIPKQKEARDNGEDPGD